VRARATADLVWRGLLLVFLTLPLLIATAVLTVTDRWWWIWVPLLLVTHQIATYRTKRLVYLKPGFFYFLVSLLILHRIHAWYSTTTAVEWSGLPAVLSMIVMAAMGTRVAER
jgi:hypothetical protein